MILETQWWPLHSKNIPSIVQITNTEKKKAGDIYTKVQQYIHSSSNGGGGGGGG